MSDHTPSLGCCAEHFNASGPAPSKQRVSNWVPTGSHSTCPNGHLDMWVAFYVYPDPKPSGWEYLCHECGATGPAEMKPSQTITIQGASDGDVGSEAAE